MRGRIIHYNASDGKGLIRAEDQQVPFEISLWCSDRAPAVNQIVELGWAGGHLKSVTRVKKMVLVKEKVGGWAERAARLVRSLVCFEVVSFERCLTYSISVHGRQRWPGHMRMQSGVVQASAFNTRGFE